MLATLLKTPYTVSFAGNPIPFIYQVSPYGAAQRGQDISLTLRVWVEKAAGSDIFDEVYIQKLYPTDDGKVEIDVSAIVNPYLQFYTPPPDLTVPVVCDAQRRRYKTTAILQNGSTQLGDEIASPVLYAVKGGLASEAWHYKEFFTKIIQEQKKPFLFSAAKELTDPEALKFLYWIYPFDDGAAQSVTYKVYLSDGSSVSLTNENTVTSLPWGVNCVPSGFNQCGLFQLAGEDKYPVKYSVKITAGEVTIVDEYFFPLDNRNFYDKYFLLYRNSIGGLETVRLLGQVDLAADYARQQAIRSLPPVWFPGLINDITEETFSYTADTGFMSKEELLKLRDVFLSKERYQCQPVLVEGGETIGLLPVVLQTAKAKFFSNKDNLVSAQIEWQLAFLNTHYTPGSLMPATRACPAVEKFIVTQLNKSTLQILWSLEAPYDLIEVQIIIGEDTYTYTYQGNTGMVSQSFDNPAIDEPVDITIQARTVCNPSAVPVDYGAFSTVVLPVIANSLPVAVDDYFNVPIGFNGDLPFSVLDNDYDPDGDLIEAVAGWGLFGNGGVYQISADGNIILSNVTVSITGQQSFDYHIREVGGNDIVTAKVYVNFGNGPQAIYIKVTLRNVVEKQENYFTTTRHGEVWLDFFSDPACTVPIDLTPYLLVVNAQLLTRWKKKFAHSDVTVSTTPYARFTIGTKILIYTGELYYHEKNSFNEEKWKTYDFTVLPGTGYTPVNP